MNKKNNRELGYKELLKYIVVFVILVILCKIVFTAYRYYDMGVISLRELYVYSTFGLLTVILLSFITFGVGKTILMILIVIIIVLSVIAWLA